MATLLYSADVVCHTSKPEMFGSFLLQLYQKSIEYNVEEQSGKLNYNGNHRAGHIEDTVKKRSLWYCCKHNRWCQMFT